MLQEDILTTPPGVWTAALVHHHCVVSEVALNRVTTAAVWLQNMPPTSIVSVSGFHSHAQAT